MTIERRQKRPSRRLLPQPVNTIGCNGCALLKRGTTFLVECCALQKLAKATLN